MLEVYSTRSDSAGRRFDILGNMMVIARRSAYDSFTIRTREQSGVFLVKSWAAESF